MHMRELFPTQVICRGNLPVRVFPVQVVELSKIPVPGLDGKKISISEWLKASQTDAFMILHDGVIVWEEYFHGMREDTPHSLHSSTKPIVGGVAARLMARGDLGENRPVTDYVEELKGTGYEGATIRHLLDMRSGVGWDYEGPPDKNSWVPYERACGLAPKLPGEPLNEGICDFMTRDPSIKHRPRAHGGYFYYKESDIQALLWACEKRTQTRFTDLLSQLIWSRIGAEQDSFMITDCAGTVVAGGGISTTLRDLGRWGQAYLDALSGKAQVIPREFVVDLLTNSDPKVVTWESFPGPRHGLPENFAYRSLHNIFLFPDENLIVSAGAYGQFCCIFPKRRLVFVKFSTYDWSNFKDLVKLDQQAREAFRAIAEALAGKPR
jgi:CubicO group peptidase (beta-lactamase class C family)